MAIQVIKFLQHIASSEPALNSSVARVLSKWIDGNAVVQALLYSTGSFYNYVQQKALDRELNQQIPSSDHVYIDTPVMSFCNFTERTESEDFNILYFLKNFKPTSCDPERLFSLCRLSKNYLQNRMTPDNQSRNVFLAQNKRFFDI